MAMRKKYSVKFVGSLLAALLAGSLFLIFLSAKIDFPTPATTAIDSTSEQLITVSFDIDFGDGQPLHISDVSAPAGSTLFAAMQEMLTLRGIVLDYQDYGGELGMFIKSINGVGNDGSSRWWQYWVNDQYGTVGVSSYYLQDGDNVIFRFTDESQESF